MAIDKQTGLLTDGRLVRSPNADARPSHCEPELIVIHAISLPPGRFGGPWIEDLFCNRLDAAAHPYFRDIHWLRVSSHALIRRDGEVVQFVPFGRRAWHAGESTYAGRSRCNDFSIGIELEGSDETPYETAQYAALVSVVKVLLETYPGLAPERITGHSDIAPGRKTDPGPAFDWLRFRQTLNEWLGS